MAILCGTCAWADHEHFYPPGLPARDRLSFYAQFFSLVEIDSSYYHIPRPDVVSRWVRVTPPDFTFNLKAYRSLTRHDRDREATEEEYVQFMRVADVLAQAGKLGAVLLQFPPWVTCGDESVAYVERLVARLQAYPLAVEFRHRSWWEGTQRSRTEQWLRDLGVVNVVCDEPQVGSGCIPFIPAVTSKQLVIFRLHGRNTKTWVQKGLQSSQQRFDYLYTREELAAFLPYVGEWAAQVRDVHILMNNNQGDYAIRNAFDWLELLGLPRGRPGADAGRQATLFD